MTISIELVPRDEASLRKDLQFLRNKSFEIEAINIPDLLRFNLRSWEGCKLAKTFYNKVIPHIRAIDFCPDNNLPMGDFLEENNINEVLVLTGDPPQDMSKKIYPTNSLDIIRKFKKELPHIKVYAAIDQYRNSLKKEFEYIKRKIDAGADGFFTQPFFDLKLMEIYADKLEGFDLYWGISPVVSERSVNYWETKNNVMFPKKFQPTLEWNIKFAKEALTFTKETKTNMYLMPIKINLEKYLEGIF